MSRANLSKPQLKFLKNLFPGDDAVFTQEEMLAYSMDAGRIQSMPQAVVRPENTGQVQELLKWAHAENIPIYPRARATNVVGSTVPVMGGVVVSCLKMNKIIEIDQPGFIATVEPGVVNGDLQKELEARRLFYPPDPASAGISTIGGNVSTNAGGMRAVKYGVTRDYVLGLEAVLPGGQVIHTGSRAHKNVVGLDFTGLFTGSCGTLGFITKIHLKLIPLPEASVSVLACFDGVDHALRGAASVFDSGLLPVAMELMDQATMRALANVTDPPWPEGAGAVLLIKLDGGREALKHDLVKAEKALSEVEPNFLQSGTGADETALWEVRRLINPAGFTLGPDKSADDIAVPRSQVGRALKKIRNLAEKFDLSIICFGHLGDGNLHVNTLYDASIPGLPEKVKKAKAEILSIALSLGGTISGEHGTGLLKKAFVPRQLSPVELELVRRVKKVFDPHNIMNPGKIA